MSIWPKRWASNFADVEGGILLDGLQFPSVEHAFQAAKTLSIEQRRKIASTATAAEAKRMGRKLKLREDWIHIRDDVMQDLLRQKFSRPAFRSRLVATGNSELVELNTWHDIYWGRCTCARHNGEGLNHLGVLLMRIREEIRSPAPT